MIESRRRLASIPLCAKVGKWEKCEEWNGSIWNGWSVTVVSFIEGSDGGGGGEGIEGDRGRGGQAGWRCPSTIRSIFQISN